MNGHAAVRRRAFCERALPLVFVLLSGFGAAAGSLWKDVRSTHFRVMYTPSRASQGAAQSVSIALEEAFGKLSADAQTELFDKRKKARIRAEVRDYRRITKGRMVVGFETEHVRLIYWRHEASDLFALKVLHGLQNGWRVLFASAGYSTPDCLKKMKVDARIARQSSATSRGCAWNEVRRIHRTGKPAEWVMLSRTEIALERTFQTNRPDPKRQYRRILATTAHELYHLATFGYAPDAGKTPSQALAIRSAFNGPNDWVIEGTARWFEQVAVPYESNDWIPANITAAGTDAWANHGYLSELRYPMFHASRNKGISLRKRTYGNALPYQTFTEQLGAQFVLNVWKQVRAGKSAQDAVVAAAGGATKLRDALGRYAAGLAVLHAKRERTHAPTGLNGAITSAVAKKLDANAPRFPSFPQRTLFSKGQDEYPIGLTGGSPRISKYHGFDMNPGAVRLIGFCPGKAPYSGRGKKPDDYVGPDVWVLVGGQKDQHWDFYLVGMQAGAGSPWSVVHPQPVAAPMYRLGRLSDFGGATAEFVVAAAHGHLTAEDKYYIGLMYAPPVITRVQVLDADGKSLWALTRSHTSGTWTDQTQATRSMHLAPGASGTKPFRVRIRASRSMENVECVLGDPKARNLRIALQPDGAARMTWEADLPQATALQHLATGPPLALPICVRGACVNKARTDPVPRTKVELKPDSTIVGWEEVTVAAGGWETHRVPASIEPPPFLTRVVVKQEIDENKTPYDGAWHAKLEAGKGRVLQHAGFGRFVTKRIGSMAEFHFSAPMNEEAVQAKLAGAALILAQRGADGKVFWALLPAPAPYDAVFERDGKGAFEVTGRSRLGQALDADPRSVAAWDVTARAWKGYEAAQGGASTGTGGADLWHELLGKAPEVWTITRPDTGESWKCHVFRQRGRLMALIGTRVYTGSEDGNKVVFVFPFLTVADFKKVHWDGSTPPESAMKRLAKRGLKQTYNLTRLSPDKMTGTAQNFSATWSWDTGEIYELDTSAKWRHPAVWERTPVEAPRSDP